METRTLKSKIGIYMLLSVLAVLVVIPFGWMLLASVKTSNEVFSIPMKLFPKEFQWVNYQTIWDKIPLLVFFKNTFKIAVCTTLLQVLTSCFAAYGFSKVEFKGRDFLFLVSVTTFAVPWQAYMVPQFALISRMGLTDSHLGLILMQAFSGFGVFLIRQFMIGIPNELLEAARIDGLTEYGIFGKIALPLVKPGIATLVIFTFVNIWNDFMGPLCFLQVREKDVLLQEIYRNVGQFSTDWTSLFQMLVLGALPLLVFYLFMQRYIIGGVMNGSIKG